ncbi:MAG: hypothetical protein R3204_05025, partial [Oceanospirillum sp.]|nr:hypothetical protein [Oceanospirillum sp.]
VINQNRQISFQDIFVKRRIANIYNIFAHLNASGAKFTALLNCRGSEHKDDKSISALSKLNTDPTRHSYL